MLAYIHTYEGEQCYSTSFVQSSFIRNTYIHACTVQQGIVRTPSAIVAMAAGKRWDDDAEEWIHYDLDYEKLKLLPVSDEVDFYTYIHTYIHTYTYKHTPFILIDSIQSDVYIHT